MVSSNDTLLLSLGGDAWNPPYHPIIQAFGWLVASALSLETILGNAMVLLAYHLERSISKQLNNRFIVSLAVSDMIIGLEGIPFFTIYVINGDRWPLGAIACETWLFLDYTLCLVSILTVLLITADRYLSVCHTARYLKWQTPAKVQMLIFASWILPALIFGIMIYGWPWIGEREEEIEATTNGECYAPFLANPFVNMSMYLAYYWTTLVAMLILYKGIHKAAKKLEKRSRAREHRHIALLLTQRLGTQVGVGLMLHARKYHEEVAKKNSGEQKQQAPADVKDSGYTTNNTLSTSESSDRRRSSFAILVKAVQSTQKLAQFRGRGTTFAFRTAAGNNDEATPQRNPTVARQLFVGISTAQQPQGGAQQQHHHCCCLERLSEQSQIGGGGEMTTMVGEMMMTATVETQTADDGTGEGGGEEGKTDREEKDRKGANADGTGQEAATTTANSIGGIGDIDEGTASWIADDDDDEEEDDDDDDFRARIIRNRFDSGAVASLSTANFHEDSLSSVLRFNPSAMASPLLDPAHSDSSSELAAAINWTTNHRPNGITAGGGGQQHNNGIIKRHCFSLTSHPHANNEGRSVKNVVLTGGSLKERSRTEGLPPLPPQASEEPLTPQASESSEEEEPEATSFPEGEPPRAMFPPENAKIPAKTEEDVDDVQGILCPIVEPAAREFIQIPHSLAPSTSHHSQQSLTLSVPGEAPTVAAKECQRRTSAASSRGERRPSSRKTSQQTAHPSAGRPQKRPSAAEEEEEEETTGGRMRRATRMLGRLGQRLSLLIQTGLGLDNGTGGESGTNLAAAANRGDPLAGMVLPSFMHNSRSFSSMSSISSTQPGMFSKRTSVLLPLSSQQQIPTLTITRDSLPAEGGQPSTQSTTLIGAPDGTKKGSLASPAVEEERRGSGFLQALFAPISTFQRRRKKTKAERRAHKAFRTITFIVGLFAILWSPYYVVATVYGFCRGDCIPALLYNISYYLCYLNSSLNPFAYALANRQFRSAFSRILRGNFRQSN